MDKTIIFTIVLVFAAAAFNFSEYSIVLGVGESMEPTIKNGQPVICEKGVSPDQGDISVYNLNGEKVMHRVWSDYGDYYVFKGDGNEKIDAYKVTEDMIECSVVGIH